MAIERFILSTGQKIRRSKVEAGLSVRPLKRVNRALLGKWHWCVREEKNKLWRQVIADKYGVVNNGWFCSQSCEPYSTGI